MAEFIDLFLCKNDAPEDSEEIEISSEEEDSGSSCSEGDHS